MKNYRLIKQHRDNALFRRKVRSKLKKKSKNRSLLGVSQQERKIRFSQERTDTFQGKSKRLVAPSNFSLLENTEEVISFINEVDTCYSKGRNLFIVMTDVERIAYGAIIVLLSKLIHFKAKKLYVNGNFPKNKEAKRILQESGFIEYLYKDFKYQDEYVFNKKICTHANKIAEPALTAQIIVNASKELWGEERRCVGVQRVFLELMQNTNNHASKNPGEKHWWTSFAHVKNEKEDKICFSFIDYGIGIFTSLANKREGIFLGIWEKIKSKFGNIDNAKIMEMLLHGEIHNIAKNSKNHKPYRGKGLPGIYGAMEKNDISNLQIISNDAYANVSKNQYFNLNNKLKGTYVYWELNINNNSMDK